MPSSINTMMHGVCGFFRFAHIDRLVPSDPAVYARLPKVHQDDSRTQGLDRGHAQRLKELFQEHLSGVNRCDHCHDSPSGVERHRG